MPICSPVSVALSDPSVASVAVPGVEVVVEVVAAVRKAVRQYYAPVALCWDLKHNLPLKSGFKSN